MKQKRAWTKLRHRERIRTSEVVNVADRDQTRRLNGECRIRIMRILAIVFIVRTMRNSLRT